MGGQHQDYITSDEYFMTIAKLAGMRSKEPLQVGTCIVDSENRILSIGYAGMPDAYNETGPEFFQENRSPEPEDTNDKSMVNESSDDTVGMRLYTSMFPSKELARKIVHSGIKTVIYDEDSSDSLSALISDRLLRSAGIICQRYRRSGRMIAVAV